MKTIPFVLILFISSLCYGATFNALRVETYAIMNDGSIKTPVELGITYIYHDDSEETYITLNNSNLENVKAITFRMSR